MEGMKAMTMRDLADWISPRLGKPVLDETDLQGRYEFVIDVRRFGDDTEEDAASQAAAKLGLKLVARKVSVADIIVDQRDRTANPN